MQVKLYSGFMKQIHKGVVSIVAKGYKSFYSGINQHLGTEYAGGVGAVNGRTFQTDAMQGGLDDDILLGMNTSAYFLPGSRFYAQLVPEAAEFKTIFESGGSPVVAGGQYVLVLHCHSAYMVASTGGALRHYRSYL